MLLCLWAVVKVHSEIASGLGNTPVGMLMFHGSAALTDLLLLHCAPTLLSGALCDDMQNLCLVSIVANFAGWLLYLAYTPPEFYNSFMWGLGCVQSLRLFLVDSDDANHMGLHLVRRPDFLGA
jgi:hypothetical protein